VSKFYKRLARLVVQNNPVMDLGTSAFVGPVQPDPPSNVLDFPGSPAVNTGTIITSPLRIQFKIEKQPYTPPNTADITVTNLSETTRKQLQQFGALVDLEAGYAAQQFADEGHLPRLFFGTARTIDHARNGTEWVTKIQCGDGEIAYRYSQANVSAAPGTAYATVAESLAKQLSPSGVDVSQFLIQLTAGQISFPRPQFVTGYAASGNALQELEKLLAPEGWLVSIQNGALQVVASNGTTPKPAVLISAASGMIGSPEHGTPDKDGLPSVLKVKSLLLPQLCPGDLFALDAVGNSGNYRAEKVTHTGDTHGADWFTEIEARPLGQSSAALNG
jgi:hypothetical protein